MEPGNFLIPYYEHDAPPERFFDLFYVGWFESGGVTCL